MRGAEPGLELFSLCRESLREIRPIAMPNPVMMQLYLDILHGMDLARDVKARDLTALRFSGGDGLEFSIRAVGATLLRVQGSLSFTGSARGVGLPFWRLGRL